MTKKNNLSINSIDKTINKLNEKFTITVSDRFNNDYEVIINKYFKKSDVNKLTGLLFQIIGELKEIEKDINKIIYVYPFLLMKLFTNVPIPDTTLEIFAYSEKLVELDIVDQIMKSISQEEIEKVDFWLKETIKTLPEVVPQLLDVINNTDLIKDSVNDGYIK